MIVPGGLKVQRGQGGRTRRRQGGAEIDAVQVDEIGLRVGEVAPHMGVRDIPRRVVQRSARTRDWQQRASHHRPLTRDHQGAVSCGDQGAVQRRQDLLGAAHRIRADRRQRVGDAEHSQHSARCASAASARQRSPVMPQS